MYVRIGPTGELGLHGSVSPKQHKSKLGIASSIIGFAVLIQGSNNNSSLCMLQRENMFLNGNMDNILRVHVIYYS